MIKHRIMVVDDDEDVRYVVTTLLGLEFETVQAQNGLDALEKIERSQPDLLLLDINMPIMNGIACCRAIQRNPEFKNLPVFFLSAASNPETRAEALEVGGRAFFDKPFESAVLIDSLKDWLQKEQHRPAEKRYSVEEIARIDSTPLTAVEAEEAEVAEAPGFEMETKRARELRHLDPSSETQVGDGGKARTRKVFGRKKEEAPAAAPPPESEPMPEVPPPAAAKPADDDSQVNLPPPPAPDYQRISQTFQRKPLLYGRKKEESPKPEEKPAAEQAPELRATRELKKEELAPRPAPTPPAATPPAPAPPRTQPPAPPQQPAVPPQNRDMRPTAPPPRAPMPPAAAKPEGPSPAEILAQRRMAVIGKARKEGGVKPRALVVIDRPEQTQIYYSALKGIAEYLPLEDPVEAIELIARFQPDIVVCSIIEKEYSGLQLASMMRSNKRLAHIEVAFVQGPWVESKHLAAARSLSKNRIITLPLAEKQIRDSLTEITGRPGFQVREKNLKYGEYVKEVLRAAEAERDEQNKQLAKQAYEDKDRSLRQFMAKELRDYKEPEGYDELKGIGRKVHNVE